MKLLRKFLAVLRRKLHHDCTDIYNSCPECLQKFQDNELKVNP